MSYRAFWQRRCRAAAAEAVLKPLGGNCAVLPLIWSAGLQAVPVNNAIQILLYTIPAVLKIALPGKAVPARRIFCELLAVAAAMIVVLLFYI